jgi:hypothetical protein
VKTVKEKGSHHPEFSIPKRTIYTRRSDKDMTDLQKAIYALESIGFHVDRAYEENNRDAGNVNTMQNCKTGAIWLRIAPENIRAFEAPSAAT